MYNFKYYVVASEFKFFSLSTDVTIQHFTASKKEYRIIPQVLPHNTFL